MNTLKILVLLCLGFALHSCVNEELLDGSQPEGIPAVVSLKMTMPKMGNAHASSTKSGSTKEDQIKGVRVMIFNKNKLLVGHEYAPNATASTQVTVTSTSGSGQTLYILANESDDVTTKMAGLNLQTGTTTLDEVRDITDATDFATYGFMHDKPLPMSGIQTNVSIAPGTSISSVPLTYMMAKLTLTVINDVPEDQEVTLIGWDIVNAPTSMYVFDHLSSPKNPGDGGFPMKGIDVNPIPTDNTADGDKWYTSPDNTRYPFERVDATTKTAATDIYILENRRGGRRTQSELTDAEKQEYVSFSDTKKAAYNDNRGKAFFAPFRSTYIRIYASHRTADKFYKIIAYIYVGYNAEDNYNIFRGWNYQYTVTVKGVNDIEIDSNLEPDVEGFLLEYGDNLNMDAHPDFRSLRVTAPEGSLSVEVMNEDGSPFKYDEHNTADDYVDLNFHSAWLKISPLNIMNHQIKQQDPGDTYTLEATQQPGFWQERGVDPGTIVRARYLPHKTVRFKINKATGNNEEAAWWNHVGGSGQTIFALSPEVYPEVDNRLNFKQAKYRMAYKITDIPIEKGSDDKFVSQVIYLYADELLNIDEKRTAKVRFSYWKKGKKQTTDAPDITTDYLLTQEGPYSVYKNDPAKGLALLTTDGKPSGEKREFVVERYEEIAMNMNPSVNPALQGLSTMQWGFPKTVVYGNDVGESETNLHDRTRNGEFLTANIIYADVNTSSHVDATWGGKQYKAIYGNGNHNNNVSPIKRDGHLLSDALTDYYYVPFTPTKYYHPIYNVSAARYCHEKNRDLNGDGIIEANPNIDNARWHLPARDQLTLLWITGNRVKMDVKPGGDWNQPPFYWSSTEVDYSKDDQWAKIVMNFGSNFSPNMGGNELNRVRCIRNL